MITYHQNISVIILVCTIICNSANAINPVIYNHEDIATYDNVTEVNRRKRDSSIRKLKLLCKNIDAKLTLNNPLPCLVIFLFDISECPSSYFLNDGHCYGFVDQSLSWYNARDQCKQIGDDYDLVTIQNDEENQFLKDKIRTDFNGNEYWTGAKENSNDNGFKWVDGSDVTYTDWTGGDPNEVISWGSFTNEK